MSRIRARWSGGFVISAVEDVVELRDGIATFDTYWHSALERVFTWLFLCSYLGKVRGISLHNCCCRGLHRN